MPLPAPGAGLTPPGSRALCVAVGVGDVESSGEKAPADFRTQAVRVAERAGRQGWCSWLSRHGLKAELS